MVLGTVLTQFNGFHIAPHRNCARRFHSNCTVGSIYGWAVSIPLHSACSIHLLSTLTNW